MWAIGTWQKLSDYGNVPAERKPVYIKNEFLEFEDGEVFYDVNRINESLVVDGKTGVCRSEVYDSRAKMSYLELLRIGVRVVIEFEKEELYRVELIEPE